MDGKRVQPRDRAWKSTFPTKSLHLTSSGKSLRSWWSILGFSHALTEEVVCSNPILSTCYCLLLGDTRVAEDWDAAEGVRQENPKGLVVSMVLL